MRLNALFYYATGLGMANALNCTPSAFKGILGSNASVVLASLLPENSTFHVPPGDVAFPQSPAGLHALCVLEVEVADSNAPYNFGLFLPKSWNGRFL
jgi:feruloyl esterase